MTSKLYSYKQGSRSARALATNLNIRRLRHEGSRWRPRRGDMVINWGSSSLPDTYLVDGVAVINTPAAVGDATNKLSFFRAMEDSGLTPAYSGTIDWARAECREGNSVVCRTKLTGHSGDGIVMAGTEDELVPAPLYTRYMKKRDEYRIHVCRGEVFDIQRKARRNDFPTPNWQVRNHENGFIYARDGVDPPAQVLDYATQTLAITGLDFGAVDVIWNDKAEQAYVLEVNTAPGLEGTTLTKYTTMMRGLT